MTAETSIGEGARASIDAAPNVSVILVSFNTRELTLQAIASARASIVNPTFRIEVIVVDNASADGSAEAVEDAFPDVRVIRSGENLGFGRGNNLGAEQARGEALLLLNTDTIVSRGAIEDLYRALRSDQSLAVVGAYLQNPDGSYQESMMSFPSARRSFCDFFFLDKVFPNIAFFADEFMIHADKNLEQDVDAVHGASMMIRREVFENLGGFDPDYFMYFEEVDLCKRTANLGFRTRFVPSARITHLVQRSQDAAPPGWYYSMLRASRMIYARKHLSWLSRASIWLIMHSGYALRIVVYNVVGLIIPKFARLGRSMFHSYSHNDLRIAGGKGAGR